MIQFAIFATLLIVAAAAFILPPLWLGLRSHKTQADRKTANIVIFRDQLAELERERAEGSLTESNFEQARQELQRRLLEEVEPAIEESVPSSHAPSQKLALALVLLLPVFGLAGYGLLGNPTALDPSAQSAAPQVTQGQIEGMVAQLAERLKANPDDTKGWLMLARSYRAMGRMNEAVEAFGHAESIIYREPDLLAVYAETIAQANGRSLKGKPSQLIDMALKIDPNHAHSLFLGGAAAMEAGDGKRGIAYWEALLPQVEPGSDIEQMLRQGIEKMRAGKSGR